jgi:hypothetical protein
LSEDLSTLNEINRLQMADIGQISLRHHPDICNPFDKCGPADIRDTPEHDGEEPLARTRRASVGTVGMHWKML